MTAHKRKSLDTALRALFAQRGRRDECAPLIAFAEQLAAQATAQPRPVRI